MSEQLHPKRWRCLPGKKWIGGVCAGLAYTFGMPTWLVRLAWVAAIIFWGFGFLLYILLWIFMPNGKIPKDYCDRTGDN